MERFTIITPHYIKNDDICIIWEDVYNFLEGYEEFESEIKLPDYIINSYSNDSEHDIFELDRFKVLKRKQASDIRWERLNLDYVDSYLIPLLKLFNRYKISSNFSCSGLAIDHNGNSCYPYFTVIIKDELSYNLYKFLEEGLALADIKLLSGSDSLFPIFSIRAKKDLYPDGKLSDSHTINFWTEVEDNLNQFMSLNI